MTQKLANFVKHLTSDCYKTIQMITERECPKCKGKGKFKQLYPDNKIPAFGCRYCHSTGKMKYVWEPEIGQFYLTPDNEIRCIGDELYLENIIVAKNLNDKYIPILDWEKIEEILEGVGYYSEEPIKRVYGSEGSKYHCVIKKLGNPKPVGVAWGNSRQEAVVLAVIKLGKEIKKHND